MTKAIVLGAVLALSAQAWAAPASIRAFSPQNTAETTNQIRAVFSTKVVSLSVNPNADIFTIACSPQVQGSARWEDETSWTFNFQTKLYANKLPGGTRCEVTLKDAFKKAKNITGKTQFTFKIDGPNIIAMQPGNPGGRAAYSIDEDQVFALGLDAAADPDSILANVKFKVDGIASPVDVRLLSEAEKFAYMKSQTFESWMMKDLNVVFIKPKRDFPAEKKVSLIFGRGVKSSASGIARERDLIIPFETRPLLTAQFTCTRENAKSDCSPFSVMELIFSAEIPADLAKQIRLVGADGTIINAQIDADAKGDSTVKTVIFPATIKEKQNYRLEIPTGIRDDAGRPLANQVAFPMVVKTAEFPPLAKFAADFGIIEANEKPVLLPATLRNLEAQVIGGRIAPAAINGKSVRLDSANFPAVVKWLKALDIKANSAASLEDRDKSIFAQDPKLRPEQVRIPLKENGKAFEVVGIPLPGPGFYVVELQSRLLGRSLLGKDANMFVPTGALVTNLVVHSKFGRENSLFWVTSLDRGQPVSGAQVVVTDCSGKAVVSGQTDSQGLFRYNGELKSKLPEDGCRTSEVNNKYDQGFFVTAKLGEDFTFTHSSWNEGIEPYRFGPDIMDRSPMWGDVNTLAHTVLDRTLLRAGETVSMKHFLRLPNIRGFALVDAAKRPSQAVITHSDTGAQYTADLTWDSAGTATSAFAIPKEAKLGLYTIELVRKEGDENVESFQTASFQVMEFKIPLMKGIIAFPNKIQQVVQPGRIDAQISVTYQDGGPAGNEPVNFRYTIAKSYGLWFEDFGYMSFGTDKIVEKEERSADVDASNETPVDVPTRLDKKGAAVVTIPGLSGFDSPRTVTTQLEFTDKNSETQNVTRTFTVYPSNRLVGVEAVNGFSSDKRIKFTAAVVDTKGQAVQGAQPAFELFERVTYTHKTRMVGGFYASESFTRISKVQAQVKCAGATNKRGRVSCEVTAPDSGDYIIQATVTDAMGNASYGSDTVYVRGTRRAWFPSENNDRMDIYAENKNVDSGSQARIKVEMPFEEANVLVTVEREGIIDAFVKTVATTDPVITVPIRDEHAPNVYVSALAVRGRVNGAGKDATATVDLGKPAYKIGLTQLNVNWQKNALKVAVKPAKEVYPPRKENAEVTVTVTDAAGVPAAGAEFAIAIVDEGLLQLAKNRTWDLLAAMMGRRSLDVETATAQMQVVGKRHYGLKAKPVGGDGGQAPTRELFDTLLYWNARVKVGADGVAKLSIPIGNDSLTKYRIAVIAHSGTGKFGKGESEIITQKDVLVIPGLGTVARQGDELSAEFTVRNTTKNTKIVTIGGTVKVTKADGSTETLTLAPQTLTLGSQGSESITMGRITMPEGAVKAEYQLTVEDQNKQVLDSIRIAQEVKPAVLARTWMAQLERVSASTAPIGVTLPQNALPNQGGVSVNLMPSLATGLSTVSDYLKDYPFISLEYRVSRAVALESKALWDEAMTKLPSHLDSEGFVMYYPSTSTSQGSEVLTAYILSVAQLSGFEVPEEQREKMLDALERFVEGRARIVNTRSTQAELFIRRVNVIEVLARYGKAQDVWLTSLPRLAPEQIPTATLIDLLSTYQTLTGAPERQAKLREVQDALKLRLTRTGTGMKLTERTGRPYFLMSSEDMDQLNLILVLSRSKALATAWATEVPLLVRGGIAMLKRGAWDLTTANAMGVLALKAYTIEFEKTAVTGETQMALNSVRKAHDWNAVGGEKGGTYQFGWPSTGDHVVDLKHQGTGMPWAVVAVNAAVNLTQKVDNGIQVERTLSPAKAAYKKGEVVTVTLKIKPQTDMPFVSIMDPIPAGAKILGSGLDNDVDSGPQTRGWAWPDHQELTYEAYKASYTSVSARGIEVVYRVQLNNAGVFKLPATRVEAIYMPENFAEVPNSDITVQP